jgi:stage V sporulation protein SpoVS
VNKAVKAVAIARGYLAAESIDIRIHPEMTNQEKGGKDVGHKNE